MLTLYKYINIMEESKKSLYEKLKEWNAESKLEFTEEFSIGDFKNVFSDLFNLDPNRTRNLTENEIKFLEKWASKEIELFKQESKEELDQAFENLIISGKAEIKINNGKQ